MPGPPGPPGEPGPPATRNLVRQQNKEFCQWNLDSNLLMVIGSTKRGGKAPSCVFIYENVFWTSYFFHLGIYTAGESKERRGLSIALLVKACSNKCEDRWHAKVKKGPYSIFKAMPLEVCGNFTCRDTRITTEYLVSMKTTRYAIWLNPNHLDHLILRRKM